jgi:hypothetical protein
MGQDDPVGTHLPAPHDAASVPATIYSEHGRSVQVYRRAALIVKQQIQPLRD